MMVKNVMYSGKSKFQEVDLIHTGPFGKVGKLMTGAAGSTCTHVT
jgi:spermidine synthase